MKPGREEEFISAWRALVPIGVGLGSGEPTLIRDRERTNVFRSFGPWPDLETINRFRGEIGTRLRGLEDVLENFETFTLDEVYPGD